MNNKIQNIKDSFHSNTKLLGLIGHPIKQSFSPYIHNITSELLKTDYIYLPFDVTADNLRNALNGMKALDIRGFNVTIPHKENILQYLDNISEEASMVGAVNTVLNDHGTLNGYNTDINGITATLLPYKEELNSAIVTIVGAGGGARAAIYSLLRNFKINEINLINRTKQRAETLKDYFTDKMKFDRFKVFELIPPDNVQLFNKSKLIINATSVGMIPDVDDSVTPLKKSFNKKQIVFDMVYNPAKTQLLYIAKKSGAKTLDGLKMLVFQAAKSYEIWTGYEMPVDKIYRSLKLYIDD